MRLLIDTNIWLRWVTRNPKYPRLISHLNSLEANSIGLSAISGWEVALKQKRGGNTGLAAGVRMDRWLAHALSPPAITVLDLTIDVAVRSVELPPALPKDPADRFIVATALYHDVPFLTSDRHLLAFKGVLHYELPA